MVNLAAQKSVNAHLVLGCKKGLFIVICNQLVISGLVELLFLVVFGVFFKQ